MARRCIAPCCATICKPRAILSREHLSRGAKANLRDETRHTPLYYTWGGSAADKEIADSLRKHGGV